MRSASFCAWLVAVAAMHLGITTAQTDNQYITVASAAAKKPGGAVRSMNATIQVVLDSNTPPQITHNNHLTWRHGKTKVILQTTWAGTEGTPWRTSFLRVSTKDCGDGNVAFTANAYGVTGRQLEWQLNDDGTIISKQNGLTTVMHELEPQRIVVDRDNALCVVLANRESVPQLKAPPLPISPDFPPSFHTGIEASITDKGYTFHLYESYSAACNAVMFSFFNLEAGYVRILTDYNNNKMVHMHPPNATHPNGVCVSSPLDPNSNMVAFEGGQLASSARFLGFLDKGGAPAEFQAPAGGVRELVRGVPVDEWMYKESTRDSEDRTNITGRFSVHLYFSTPEWHFGRSNGYRTLQRVALKGRRNVVNGTDPVTHSYDFVDFQPFIPPYITFEPCEMLPGGDGCNCLELGCTSASPDDVAFFTEPNGGVVAQGVSDGADEVDGAASVAEACETLDGYHSGTEHDRELLGVWFFGIVVGIVMALLGVFITSRIRKKRIAEQLQQEMTHQQADSAAQQTGVAFAGPYGGEHTAQ